MPPLPTDINGIVPMLRIDIPKPAMQGSFAPASVDLIAMLVSDSGLASNDPQWWNSSVKGCILIGLQPRGGWQIMQRTVQWGNDHLSQLFGVTCSKPAVYAYFACSIRNRLEKWESTAWTSPTEGQQEGAKWKYLGRSSVERPGKLIDGSRGGQAFICDLLLPADGKAYPIVDQARMQFLSILLVAAGLIKEERLDDFDEIIQEDFQLSERLGVIFRPLFIGLIVTNVLTLSLAVACFYSIFKSNFLGASAPYLIQSTSLLSWAVGAVGLLMLGGNPRVRIVNRDPPAYIEDRLNKLKESVEKEESASEDASIPKFVKVSFGSIHGSVFTEDQGSCSLPFEIADRICRWDVELARTRNWQIGFLWWGLCLLIGIGLQILSAQVANLYSTIFSVSILLLTALARGFGVAGPEEWLIPRWKRRMTAAYGASLVGKMESRK